MQCGKEDKSDSVSKHLSMGEKTKCQLNFVHVLQLVVLLYVLFCSFLLFFLLLSLFHILSRDFLI